MNGKLYSTKEAAVYLGISERTMKSYIHEKGLLKGQKIGHSLVFTQDELDTFKEWRKTAKGFKRHPEDV